MLASAFRTLRAVQRVGPPPHPGERSSPPAQLAQALAATLIAFMVGGFFLSLAYRDLLYVLLALAVGLGKGVRGLPHPVARPVPRRA